MSCEFLRLTVHPNKIIVIIITATIQHLLYAKNNVVFYVSIKTLYLFSFFNFIET